MHARIYARVSTEEQAASGFSLAAQQERLAAFCLSQDWEIAGTYVDEGVSAKDLNRPAFRRMMAEVTAGEVLLVYKLDRLTRSVRDLDDLLRELDRRGVLFRSATEQFDTTTATGRLFIRMVAEMAQWERETIAERTAMGKQRKAAAGEWGGGPVPFGYLAVPSDRIKAGRRLLRLVPDPIHGHIVPLLFQRYLAGHGFRAIAGWLDGELGLATARGARFTPVAVRRILTNPLYCGDVAHGPRAGRPVTRAQGQHEPLVTREEYERVQALLASRKRVAPRQATGRYPLSGTARCGVCGGRLDGQMRAGGSRVYRCHNYLTGKGCGGPRPLASVSARWAEEALLQELERRHQLPTDLARYLTAAESHEAQAMAGERRRLVQETADAEAALGRWKRLFETGQITDSEYLAEARGHQERLAQLRGRLERAPATQAQSEPPAVSLREGWAGLEPPERKALLVCFIQAFGVELRVFPDRRVEVRPVSHPSSGADP